MGMFVRFRTVQGFLWETQTMLGSLVIGRIGAGATRVGRLGGKYPSSNAACGPALKGSCCSAVAGPSECYRGRLSPEHSCSAGSSGRGSLSQHRLVPLAESDTDHSLEVTPQSLEVHSEPDPVASAYPKVPKTVTSFQLRVRALYPCTQPVPSVPFTV